MDFVAFLGFWVGAGALGMGLLGAFGVLLSVYRLMNVTTSSS